MKSIPWNINENNKSKAFLIGETRANEVVKTVLGTRMKSRWKNLDLCGKVYHRGMNYMYERGSAV